MSHLFDDVPPRPAMKQAWAGVVATAAPNMSSDVWVTIPDLDPDTRVGPCHWQSRNNIDLPDRGDTCLVIFDNDNQPWVVCWWPY